ncbi:SGNH/GDSL hydrolase family protein [Pseudacidovorax intermedius]|uniref:SGNH/GDSL hydrolase family protein n=1 Tax=Pseudacidovorax intermedius TaxID=433924 RepID=UPI0026ECE750|nr:SGNH/GDSL hydrolase family protein [Pseudacidovorax intermedius]
MPILDIPDLAEGYDDLQTIKQVARSYELQVLDGNGNTIKTLRGALAAIDADWQGVKEDLNGEAAGTTAWLGATVAQTASDAALQARDQLLAAGNARTTKEEALADPSIPVGGKFTAPLPDGSLQAYTKTSTAVATPFGAPFATQANIDAKAADSDTVRDAVRKQYGVLAGATSTGSFWPSSAGYAAFSFAFDAGVDVAVGARITAITGQIAVPAGCASVRVRIYSRITADPTPDDGPGRSADTLLTTVSRTPAQLGLALGAADVKLCTVPLSTIVVQAGRTYIVLIEALSAGGALMAMGMGYLLGQSAEARIRRHGWYKVTVDATPWSWINANAFIALNFCADSFFDFAAMQAANAGTQAQLDTLKNSFTLTAIAVAVRAPTVVWPVTDGRGGWAVGVVGGGDIPGGETMSAITWKSVTVAAGAATVVCERWTRLNSGSASAEPGAAGDVALPAITMTLEQAGLTAGAAARDVTFSFPSPITAAGDTTYLYRLKALDADGVRVASGIAYTQAVTGLSQVQRGFYWSNVASGGMSGVNVTGGIAWTLTKSVYVPANSAAPAVADSATDSILSCTAAAAGLVVSLSGSYGRQGVATPFAGAVTLAAATTGTQTDTLTIAYAATPIYAGTSHLSRANVSAVVAKDAANNPLALDTDYLLNPQHGVIVKKTAGSYVGASVTYNFARRRYDVIYIDPESKTLGVVQGTERDRDAAEFIPTIPSKAVALYHARLVGATVELIPVWYVTRAIKASLLGETEFERRRAHKLLRKTLGSLRAGKPLTMAVYSDSQGAIQSGIPSTTVPNGALRDRATTYLADAIGADLISQQTLFTSLSIFGVDDGAGQVHTKFGLHWEFKTALEQAFGYADNTIGLLNFGIGSTTSGSEAGPTPPPGGTEPTRLAALTASAATLVLIMFGQNEIGATTTEGNIAAIVTACRNVGKEVIVIGVPRFNAQRLTYTPTQWLFTNRALERAARSAGAAYLNTTALYADENLGVMGMSAQDFGQANLTNHPGIREMAILGQAAAALLLDE